MSFMFEKLEVYQRAVDLAEKVAALTDTFPTKGHYHLADQPRRASLSISLNIAEGKGRWRSKEIYSNWILPKALICESLSGPCLEISFELHSAPVVLKTEIRNNLPRTVFGCV